MARTKGKKSGGFPKWVWVIIGLMLLTGAILGILAAAGVHWWGGKDNNSSAPVSNGGGTSKPSISLPPAHSVQPVIPPSGCIADINANNIMNFNQGMVEANICTAPSQCCSNSCQIDPVKSGYLMGIDPAQYAPDALTGATTLATLKYCGVPTGPTGPGGCAYGLNIGGNTLSNLISGGGQIAQGTVIDDILKTRCDGGLVQCCDGYTCGANLLKDKTVAGIISGVDPSKLPASDILSAQFCG